MITVLASAPLFAPTVPWPAIIFLVICGIAVTWWALTTQEPLPKDQGHDTSKPGQ